MDANFTRLLCSHESHLKDFYELLTSIRWRSICDVLKEKQQAANLRRAMGSFDDEKIAKIEKHEGRKMLRTMVLLTFKTMDILSLAQAEPEQSATLMIVCQWRGLPGIPPVQVTSRVKLSIENRENVY